MKNKIILSNDDQTIIAQATPTGPGAIALIRLTGINVIECVQKFCKLLNNKKIGEQKSHTIHYATIITQDKLPIDKVLFFFMRAPATFTGQDTIEISCHNNIFIIQSIIQEALKHGARLAQEGEFTKRAFLHKKIDLIQAESINELIHANSPLAIKNSLAQVEGSLSYFINRIEQHLFKVLALTQASFEFLDDENITFTSEIKAILTNCLEQIQEIKKTFDQQKQLRTGIRIALIGSVNTGKSSLFNALLQQERSIVTNIAGTTRDSIEAGLYKDNLYWTLIDTAGLRQTEDIIEQIGIKRSIEQAVLADIILLVIDASRTMTTQEEQQYQQFIKDYDKKIILVFNKSDLPSKIIFKKEKSITCATCSIIQKTGIRELEQEIQKKIETLLNLNETSYLLNQRQFNLLHSLEQELTHSISLTEQANQYELLSIHIQEALEIITQLTGKSISEHGMDLIFKQFCIGK